MPKVPILMPQLGESIAEATVVRVLVKAGEWVETDHEMIEVETNKATMSVPTLCRGEVSEILCREGETYGVGSVLGVLEVTEEEIEASGLQSLGDDGVSEVGQSGSIDVDERGSDANDSAGQESSDEANLHFRTDGEDYREPVRVEPSVKGLPVPAGAKGAHYISPRLRARMNELGLRGADVSAISGSGAGGRVTVRDLEEFIEYISQWPNSPASPMRLAVADAMRRSGNRPLASVGMPTALDRLLKHRKEQRVKPGITLYLVRALAIALKERPNCAGYLIGHSFVHPRSFDVGMAVEVGDGVMVPVLRSVDQTSLAELTDQYDRLVKKAQARKLSEADCKGGVATVTNFGVFGITWATPIPLPTETLILGMGAGRKMPVWSDEVEAFLPVTQAELVVSFDHRVVDGGDAGKLLAKVSELLNQPELL